MRALLLSLSLTLLAPQALAADAAPACADLFNTSLRKLHSDQSVDLCALTAGKPVLVVNTASNCGYTGQFAGLEQLHKSYGPKGLVVLGVPSDDFFQEEDAEGDTAKVCYINYGVTFTMLAPASVRGSDALPLFKTLAERADAAPKWNFTKYLVAPDGRVTGHWGSSTTPDDGELLKAVEALLPAR